jgi:uncharacterized protein involved in exopolysaccharide biosynthesis
VDLPSLWRVVWRYRVLVACAAIICGSIAAAIALLTTPVYRADVTVVLVDNQNLGRGGALLGQLGGLASLAGVELGGGTASMRDAKAVLASRFLVEEFIKRNKLQQLVRPGSGGVSLWKAVETFEKQILTISDDIQHGKTVVGIAWTDPAVAARWANQFVALANEVVRQRAMISSQRNIDYLNQQLAKTTIVELQKVMYGIIEQETKTLMLANAQPEYAFAVIDPAVPPEERFKPKRTLIVLIGLVLGALLGIIVAFAHSVLRQEKRPAPAVA